MAILGKANIENLMCRYIADGNQDIAVILDNWKNGIISVKVLKNKITLINYGSVLKKLACFWVIKFCGCLRFINGNKNDAKNYYSLSEQKLDNQIDSFIKFDGL